MADPTKKNRGKKGNKRLIHGRTKRRGEAYRAAGKREINKARRLFRHLKANPGDSSALAALESCADADPRSGAAAMIRALKSDWRTHSVTVVRSIEVEAAERGSRAARTGQGLARRNLRGGRFFLCFWRELIPVPRSRDRPL